MAVVQSDFAVAHDHDEIFAIVAERYLYRPQRVGGGDELLHFALFGFHDVQPDSRTQGKEMVQALIAPNGGQPEVVRGPVRGGDEFVVVFAVVGFDHQDAAGAAEHGHVPVAGVAVQVRAAFRGVQHVAVQVADFRADGPPVFRRVLQIIRVLDGNREQVAFQGNRRAVLGADVHHQGREVIALVFQFMLVDQRNIAGTVVEDRRPFTAHVKMHGPVSAQVGGQAVHVRLHQVEVVAVLFQVDAAVKNVRGVGVRGHGDGVTPGSAGVDAAGSRTQVKFVLVDLAGLQVDHRQSSGLPVSNQEAAHGLALVSFSFHRLLAVAVAVVIFGEGQFHQFLRLQPFRCDDHDGIRGRGVVDQLFHLRGQSAAVADDHRRFRDADAVLRSAVPGVRIAPDGNEAMHRNVVSTHLGYQVGQQGIAGDHVNGFGFRLSHLPRAGLS